MSDITIYHNPRCSKSRATLAILEEKSDSVSIVKYLETPPDSETIKQLLEQLGFSSARQLMRRNETLYKSLALKGENSESALIKAMSENPQLIERPIVVANGKAVIGRPPESVLEII